MAAANVTDSENAKNETTEKNPAGSRVRAALMALGRKFSISKENAKCEKANPTLLKVCRKFQEQEEQIEKTLKEREKAKCGKLNKTHGGFGYCFHKSFKIYSKHVCNQSQVSDLGAKLWVPNTGWAKKGNAKEKGLSDQK